ncbi:MAG: hypothetical protein GXP54_13295 [Deltaproteobacteria bacterium]|nr:hypothetical protein [Deltaproteobacteria bacterium]
MRWSAEGQGGIVESLFLKFHIPEEGAAFWTRYTLRRPLPGCGKPVGCLWAVHSSVTGEQTAGCDTYSASEISVDTDPFNLTIGPGGLSMGRATGRVKASGGGELEWDLGFEAGDGCLVHFPLEAMYHIGFPRNKLASPHVSTRFYGTVRVGDRTFRVDGARGMQGHNWGPGVSDHWVWSHINTFEGRDDVVFEGLSSILRLGPVSLPPLTILYLKVAGREWLLNAPHQMLLGRSSTEGLTWKFGGCCSGIGISGTVAASSGLTTGLDYISSDGSVKRCLNSNLADARIMVTGLPEGALELTSLRTATLEMGGEAAIGVDVPVTVKG